MCGEDRPRDVRVSSSSEPGMHGLTGVARTPGGSDHSRELSRSSSFHGRDERETRDIGGQEQ